MQDLNAAYLKHRPLEQPTLVLGNSHSAAGLNNPFPPVTAQDISRLLAAGCAVRGVDVENQMTVSLTPPTWGSWLQMLDTTPANAQFRVLETGFRHQVAPPAAVTAVDWHFTLPQNAPGSSSPQQVPNPNIFGCFMGMNTFQDFAIAPGGQNAWLSVSDGDLWVFLVPPSPANLRAYQQWQSPSSASTSADTHPARVFLAEHVDKCIKTVVSAGSTLLVPSGWLVALFADNNCSYFSGLFFSTSGLDKQLQIIMDHEQRDDRLGATWKETGWFAADTTAQTWAAITFSVRQLLIPDTTALVSEQDKAVLLRSLPLIRRWCASPLALKACDSLAWTPSSLAEAQDIVNRLEQALSMAMSHFGMAGLSNAADQHPTSSLPSITPTEANYIYSATGVNDGWPGVDAVNNFHASMPSFWGEFSPPAVDHMGTTAPDANNFFSNAFGGEFTSLGGPFMGHAGMGGVYFGDGMGNATTPPASAASTPMRQALDARGQLVDALVRHRASCHRCGNLRKKNVRCPKCPHIFCQKCAEKMVEEHGERIFADGCPVCKERCCCGKNRSTMCVRKVRFTRRWVVLLLFGSLTSSSFHSTIATRSARPPSARPLKYRWRSTRAIYSARQYTPPLSITWRASCCRSWPAGVAARRAR